MPWSQFLHSQTRLPSDHLQLSLSLSLSLSSSLFFSLLLSLLLDHPDLLTLNLHKPLPKLDWCLHNIRESARRLFWNRHHDRARRDSFRGQSYNADAYSWARHCADQRSFFAVLSGAAVNPACLASMKHGMVDEFCPKCSRAVAPTWLHLALECPGLQSERECYIRDPCIYPEDMFHKRTGWPTALCGRLTRAGTWLA